jgi:hypothetical protein
MNIFKLICEFGIKFKFCDLKFLFDDLKFQNTMYLFICNFFCVYVIFHGTWCLCCFYILGLDFYIVTVEFILNH